MYVFYCNIVAYIRRPIRTCSLNTKQHRAKKCYGHSHQWPYDAPKSGMAMAIAAILVAPPMSNSPMSFLFSMPPSPTDFPDLTSFVLPFTLLLLTYATLSFSTRPSCVFHLKL